MAYSKDAFVQFSELDLDYFLGEYTNSEIELSEEERVDDARTNKRLNSAKTKQKRYVCDQCTHSYASISGLQRHMRTRHATTSVTVARHRSGQRVQKNPFTFKDEQFLTSVEASLQSMVETAKKRSFSIKRKAVGEKAEQILQKKHIFQAVCDTIKPYYANVFELASHSTGNMNEALFAAFHTATVDDNLNSKLQKISESNNTFVACFHHQLMQQLISSLSEMLVSDLKQTKDLTDMEQNVIFYISGYMIYALHQKASKGSKHEKKKLLLEAMEQCMTNINSGEKTFVGKYSEWFDKVNRDGLTTPCASFFLRVREMEIVYRQNVDESKSYIDLAVLVELMAENFMIRYYAAKLFTCQFESFVLEACIRLFLNVRGHAWAQKCKNADNSTYDKKALRKSLMTSKYM